MKYKNELGVLLKGCKKEMLFLVPCIMVVSFVSFVQPVVVKVITDDGMVKKQVDTIVMYTILLFAVCFIAQNILFIQSKLLIKTHKKIAIDLFSKTLNKMYSLPIGYYNIHGGAEIANRIAYDVDTTATIIEIIFSYGATSAFQLLFGLFGLTILNWKLALIVLAVIPFKYICIIVVANFKKKHVIQYMNNIQELYAWLDNMIAGIKEIKIWQIKEKLTCDYKKICDNLLNAYSKSAMSDQMSSVVDNTSNLIFQCIVYVVGGIMVANDELSLGSMLAFIAYAGNVLSPISMFVQIKYNLESIKPSVERLLSFLEIPGELEQLKQENYGKKESINPIIEFDNVGFSYGGQEELLKNVSFKIYEGEKILLVGENGSGKSTLLDLILGFYYPSTGTIKVRGCNIMDYNLEHLRGMFSVVLQDPYMFNDTIENNINIKGDKKPSAFHLICEECGVEEFVNKDDKGYGRMLGVSGNGLSGGEKKKVAVARALLNPGDVYIFDEATEGYDEVSYSKFHVVLKDMLIGKTVISISHKTDDVKFADRVLEIYDGYVKERITIR